MCSFKTREAQPPDGDMPNGACQQKDLCATPAVSKVAQSLEFTRWGDWPTRGGPLAVETGGPRPRRGDPGLIDNEEESGSTTSRSCSQFLPYQIEILGLTRLARYLVNPRGEWVYKPPYGAPIEGRAFREP